jgi:hypothetical protein
MAHLEVKVTNSYGTFSGKITMAANAEPGNEKVVMREMIGGINNMKMLSIENEEGESTVFGESILKESVVTIKAVG